MVHYDQIYVIYNLESNPIPKVADRGQLVSTSVSDVPCDDEAEPDLWTHCVPRCH